MLDRLLDLLCWYFIALLLLVWIAALASFVWAFVQAFRETLRRMQEPDDFDPENN